MTKAEKETLERAITKINIGKMAKEPKERIGKIDEGIEILRELMAAKKK